MKDVAFIFLLLAVAANSFSLSPFSRLGGPAMKAKGGNMLQLVTNVAEATVAKKKKDSATSASFLNFDYESQWYPVSWERDLTENEPTKVTVFDIDYVIAKTSQGIICLEDKCTHKAAALSEGRVSSNGKNFQCAYHGWSFDGKSGKCVEIPQLVKLDRSMGVIPSRSCANAVPAQIHQELVWIFPGGGLEKALQAPPPPSVSEVGNNQGLKMTQYVRDFPIDWPILVSNIFDPDHGLFAHQATAFDMYSASIEFPLDIEQEYPNNGKGWILKGKVDSRDKLLEIDSILREDKNAKKGKDDKKEKWATSYFHAPFHLQLKRIDKSTGTTNFVSTFYVCPVGVGRARFMSAFCSKTALPRWLAKLNTDNFLDQDTYLLATQQQHILSQEARDVQEMLLGVSSLSSLSSLKSKSMKTRKNMFCLTSPSEKIGARLEQFWDATLLRVPNRTERLLQLHAAGSFSTVPSREVVLDRKSQQTDICKDTQGTLKNVQRISKISKIAGFTALFVKALGKFNSYPKLATTLGLCFLTSWLSGKMEKEFYFKYTDDYRKRDLSKIPDKVWIDKE